MPCGRGLIERQIWWGETPGKPRVSTKLGLTGRLALPFWIHGGAALRRRHSVSTALYSCRFSLQPFFFWRAYRA